MTLRPRWAARGTVARTPPGSRRAASTAARLVPAALAVTVRPGRRALARVPLDMARRVLVALARTDPATAPAVRVALAMTTATARAVTAVAGTASVRTAPAGTVTARTAPAGMAMALAATART